MLRLRLEVIDRDLTLVQDSEHELPVVAPGAALHVNVALAGVRDPPSSALAAAGERVIAAVRVVPERAEVPLGARVHLSAEAQDAEGVSVPGVRLTWGARDADGQDVPISAMGDLVARMPGVVEVTASGGSQVAAATVVVRDPEAPAPGPADFAGAASAAEPPEPRWNDGNAASAFLPRNRIGQPWLGVRRDELTEAATVGSANYTFSAPVVRLDGRGMDLQLDLTYNARLWNRTGDVVQFDVDRGWPAPGWSLGFGRVVRLGDQGSMVVDADGTRHPYEVVWRAGNPDVPQVLARTTDGTFLEYSHIDDRTGGAQSAQVRHPDGTWVDYTAKGRDVVFMVGSSSPAGGPCTPRGSRTPTATSSSSRTWTAPALRSTRSATRSAARSVFTTTASGS